MERVLLIGCSGAGKTTLARALGAKTGLPVVHLDRHYWRPGWVEPEKDVWRRQVEELIAAPRWIIDGNYGGTLELRLTRADTVVMFDFPMWQCLAQAFWRSAKGYGKTRADMGPDCPEKFELAFARFIWRFQIDTMPRMYKRLEAFGGRLVVVRTRADVAAFLEN